jgi:hypothetical protein
MLAIGCLFFCQCFRCLDPQQSFSHADVFINETKYEMDEAMWSSGAAFHEDKDLNVHLQGI